LVGRPKKKTALNLASKTPSLALTLRANRATKNEQIKAKVSINCTACGKIKWSKALASYYNKIPKQLPVRNGE